jgi:hypothetical protein
VIRGGNEMEERGKRFRISEIVKLDIVRIVSGAPLQTVKGTFKCPEKWAMIKAKLLKAEIWHHRKKDSVPSKM